MKIVMLKSMLCAAFFSSDVSRDNSQSSTDTASSAGSTPRSCPPSVEKIKEEPPDALENGQCRKNVSTLIFSFYRSSVKPMTTSISNLLTTKINAVLVFKRIHFSATILLRCPAEGIKSEFFFQPIRSKIFILLFCSF